MIINVAASAQSVGDIAFDPKTDDPNFKLCRPDWVWQNHWVKNKMDETSLVVDKEFRSKFKTRDEWKNENGLIRIRFVVNCEGKADRYRLLELDFDTKPKHFSESLKKHLTDITRSIPWPARRAYSQNGDQQTVDYYHYFSVRITNGQLTDVVQ